MIHGHLKREFQFYIQISDNDNRLTSVVILYFSFIEASNLVYEARLKRPAMVPAMVPENGHQTDAKPAPLTDINPVSVARKNKKSSFYALRLVFILFKIYIFFSETN